MNNCKNKNTNASQILKILLNHEIAQSGLVQKTGLKKATISSIVTQLKNKGLIIEKGVGESGSKGGRKPRFLELARENIVGIGASFRDLVLKTNLVDLTGRVIWSNEERVERNHSSAWLPALLDKINTIMKDIIRPEQVFVGLGFSTGGIYDPEKGVFRCFSSGIAPETQNDEKDVDVSKLTRPEFPDMKVVSDDFPNAMAMGEMWFGCARSLSDFLYLQVINPKATIVSGRAVVRGSRFFAGEVAGMRYGNESIAAALKRSGYSADVAADFFLNLLLCYSPEKIILSLENLPQGAPLEMDAVRKKLDERINEIKLAGLEATPVETGTLGREDGAMAAAALLFDDYFNTFTLKQE